MAKRINDPNRTKCPVCDELYCSLDCWQVSNHNCLKLCETPNLTRDEYTELKASLQSDFLSMIFGISGGVISNAIKIHNIPMLGLPGPISGPIPKKLVAWKEEPFHSLFTPAEQQQLQTSTKAYYLVLLKDIREVWLDHLTIDQRKEIKAWIDK